MGNPSSHTVGGPNPAWSQMTPIPGTSPPDPMREMQRQINEQWNKVSDLPWGPERAEFRKMRDWFRAIKDMPSSQQGLVSFGPPLPAAATAPPQLAESMTVPQFPGVPQHDGTIVGLLAALTGQTGTGGGGGGGGGGGTLISTPFGDFTREELAAQREDHNQKLRGGASIYEPANQRFSFSTTTRGK